MSVTLPALLIFFIEVAKPFFFIFLFFSSAYRYLIDTLYSLYVPSPWHT